MGKVHVNLFIFCFFFPQFFCGLVGAFNNRHWLCIFVIVIYYLWQIPFFLLQIYFLGVKCNIEEIGTYDIKLFGRSTICKLSWW